MEKLYCDHRMEQYLALEATATARRKTSNMHLPSFATISWRVNANERSLHFSLASGGSARVMFTGLHIRCLSGSVSLSLHSRKTPLPRALRVPQFTTNLASSSHAHTAVTTKVHEIFHYLPLATISGESGTDVAATKTGKEVSV